MSDQNKELVRQFVEAGNRRDMDALDGVLAPDFVRHCEATPEVNVRNLEEFKQFCRDTAATFPDLRVTLDTLVAEGNRVAFYGKFKGTQEGPMGPFPATGKQLESEMAGMFRIHDGKIAELWIIWDNVAGLVQLGHFPPPAST